MIHSYIMAKIEAGKEAEIYSKIKSLGNIRESHFTYGTYDLLMKASFEKNEDLDDFVFNVVRKIPGVKETITVIVAKTIVG